jgi:hypothetical protein
VTRQLAASGQIRALGVSAGQHLLAGGQLSARDLGGLLLLAVIAAAVYLGSCRVWPYGPCLACRGRPRRNHGSTGRRHGRCRVCRGTGERLRVGTRIIRSSGYRGGRWPS